MIEKPWRTYQVTVEDFGSDYVSARSRAHAIAQRFRDFGESYPDLTFVEFKSKVRAQLAAPPDGDGYSYVRRVYGVDPKIGGRMRLINEGRNSGRTGTVVYPGRSTAHVHVLFDGDSHPMRVHPGSFQPIDSLEVLA